MNLLLKSIAVITLSVATLTTTFAATEFLITHNHTDLESNAFVAGSIPSPYPTAANTTRQVYWNMVRIACYGHIVNNLCAATIKVGTNTARPITVGEVFLDLKSGEITPKYLSAQGYTFIVDGIGEASLFKE
jgi:hypothetical protein